MGASVRSGEKVAVSAVLLAAPLVLLSVSGTGESSGLAAFSPMFFPAGVLWGWAAIAALVLASELIAARVHTGNFGPDAPEADSDAPGVSTATPGAVSAAGTWLRIAVVVLAMLGYVILVTRMGFLLSSIAFTLIALITLGARSVVTILAYGVLMPAALFVLFHHLLGLPLPTSPFSYLF